MRVNIPLLLIAIAVLWLPRTWLRRGASVWRRSHVRGTKPGAGLDGASLSITREFTKARNYVDFLRAAFGTLVLVGDFGIEAVIRAEPLAPRSLAMRILLIQAGILLIGVLLQSVRVERRLSVSAPVFYLTGILVLLCPPWAVLCGVAIAWLLTPAFPNVTSFLLVQATVIGGVSAAFGGIDILLLLGLSLSLLPMLISLLARRPLTVFARRGSTSMRLP